MLWLTSYNLPYNQMHEFISAQILLRKQIKLFFSDQSTASFGDGDILRDPSDFLGSATDVTVQNAAVATSMCGFIVDRAISGRLRDRR